MLDVADATMHYPIDYPFRVGDLVFHGTDTPLEFSKLGHPGYGHAWVSDNFDVARDFVGWRGEVSYAGEHRVLTYRFVKAPRLLVVHSKEQWGQILEAMLPEEVEELGEWGGENPGEAIYDETSQDELAEMVCSLLDVDGWHMPDYYRIGTAVGSDTLLCYPEDFLEQVSVQALKQRLLR